LRLHNGIDSSIRLNPTASVDPKYAQFDRSNLTVFTAAATVPSHYDPTAPDKFFAGLIGNELAYGSLNPWYQPTYSEIAFLGIDINYGTQIAYFRFFTHTAQLTGADLALVLSYARYTY
jgi:hypothetical protein